jgi:hypothetical protein
VRALAIQYPCGASSCPVYIGDPSLGQGSRSTLQLIPQFAAFSPDDNRLAVSSASGDVELLDATTRRDVARIVSPDAPVPALPLAWTADSRTLLIVRQSHVDIVRGSDGSVVVAIDQTYGLEQLVALP